MSIEKYTATKSRSNRPGWSMTFRHPLRNYRGRAGLKMRRGLNTANDMDADRMIEEMNAILGDQSWWSATRRKEAEQRFSKQIVSAFYDEIQAGRDDPEALREAILNLPSKDDGYSRIQFVGTTGAGKTSLLRQLIGSDPDEDRFPSTAPAKTTIADIEVVLAEGDFQAVVTFFTEFQTQANIEECVIDAALAVLENNPLDNVADRFLNHRDQKFRLSYILGSWRTIDTSDGPDEISFDEEEETKIIAEEGDISDTDRLANRQVIDDYLVRIKKLAASVVHKLKSELDPDEKEAGADKEALQQLVEESFDAYLTRDESFHELVQDILDSVRTRFDFVEAGNLERRPSGWPNRWVFKSENRAEFIRYVRRFSSNYWPHFGRLLTPLVEGMRVRGPLFPEFMQNHQKLVFIDGQGLGHTPDASSSVSTRVSRRFAQVDIILLVDNAQQPMQAAPLSVLREIASSGYHSKLAIAFTHFDQIKGQSLPSFADKRAHVMASVLNSLSSLRDVLGASVVKAIEHGIDKRCFMLGGVDRNRQKLPPRAADYMKAELLQMVDFFEAAILPPPPIEARPIYDPTGIAFAVQDAIAKFQGPWLARLGKGSYEGFRKEHWTRIKALNRRIASGDELDYEYDSLRPIADLVMQLRESLSRFLNTPIGWTKKPSDDQEEQAIVARVRQVVDVALRDLARQRLVELRLPEWQLAYDGPTARGKGSSDRRASAIHAIYDAAAPMPDAVMTPSSVAFLTKIRGIVVSAIEANGGEVRLAESN